jgi:hypothetical protein
MDERARGHGTIQLATVDVIACVIDSLRRMPLQEWGDKDGAPPVVSGQGWGEENLIGRPAILDMPVGKGHVVSFNFNPMHRDLNRGDQRLLWNAILNW